MNQRVAHDFTGKSEPKPKPKPKPPTRQLPLFHIQARIDGGLDAIPPSTVDVEERRAKRQGLGTDAALDAIARDQS